MSDLIISGDFTDFSDVDVPLGIRMQNYTSMGEVAGRGKVSIEAVETIDVDNRNVNYYIRFEVISSTGDASGSSLISIEGAEKIMLATDRLQMATAEMTKFNDFNVSFRGEDTLAMSVFSNSSRNLTASIQVDGAYAYFPSLSKLGDLKRLIMRALTYIQANRLQ